MRRTFLKTGIIAVCMVLTFGLLSGCGASSPVGTWYDEYESFYNFDEGGKISYYQPEFDSISYGDWVENNGSYEVNGFASGPMMCKLKNNKTLYCDEYDFTLKRGAERDTPAITGEELKWDSWVTADGRYELTFHYSDDWDLHDNNEGENIKEGTYIIEEGIVSMKTEDGIQYQPTIAENRHEMTVFDDMVFIKEE